MAILPIRPGEMLRTIPSFHGAERLATAVERIDRQVVDELLHLLGQLRERTGRPTPVVQIAGVEGGEGASTISALLGRIAADVSRGAVLMFSDFQPSGTEEPALAPPVSSNDAQTNTVGVEGEVYVCPLSALRSLKPHNRDPAERSAAEVVKMLREHFVLILIDSGPVMGSIDHLRDVQSFDGVLLVVHADRTSISKAKSALKRLTGVGGNILGTIVNRERRLLPSVFSPQK
jgi:Mrp family chromosome partitioning ATPase